MHVLWYVLTFFVVGYVVLISWLRSFPRQVIYHTFWSPVFKRLTNHMQATTIFGVTLMLDPPPAMLSEAGRRHEDCHVAQWRAQPFTFVFRYFWQTLRHGYQLNQYEIDARAAETVTP